MSLETTLARAASNAADDAWQLHKRDCSRCAAAARRRRYDQLCAPGADLRKVQAAAAADLKLQRELDKLAAPGQSALF